MSTLEKAVQTQLDNIQKKVGKSLAELSAIAKNSGMTRHGEILAMFKEKFGVSRQQIFPRPATRVFPSSPGTNTGHRHSMCRIGR